VSAPAEVISGVPIAADLDTTVPRPMIAILDAKPGLADELRDLVTELTACVRAEPGCLAFIPYQSHDAPERLYLYEVYRDLDAFRTHLHTDHVKHFVATAPEYCIDDTSHALVQLDEISLPRSEGAKAGRRPPAKRTPGSLAWDGTKG
jgi:quinol monooxygenase YgiN